MMATPLLSIQGLLGATITVAATTLDDAIWLVPFVGSTSYSPLARMVHAALFLLTLESMAVSCVVVATIVASGVQVVHVENPDIILGSIAAILCWTLAAFFYVKKWMKRQRRQQQQQQQQPQNETTRLVTPQSTQNDTSNAYESTTIHEPTESSPQPLTCSNVGTVISLTILGALDEMSYFPALVIGNIFTPWEICVGTFLAALIILLLVTCCLVRCQPLADCLDRIPIYAIISLFAVVLTAGVVYDLLD